MFPYYTFPHVSILFPYISGSGYIIKSVTFDFADLPVEKQKRLPNLLEWLDPRWRTAMAKWIEEEVMLDATNA